MEHDEQLSLFAGQVSHDLRTPLTAILANAEMLSAEPAVREDEDVRWMVDAISRAGHRLDAMVEQMLAFAQEGGEPVLSVTSLNSVFELALEDLAPVVAESQAEVTVPELPKLAVDARQLYSVARNLLSNALKFARPDTPPRVLVSAECLDDRWRVQVTDNGIGVAPELRESMFVLFARADKRVEGSGIGLASAKRIVEAHGGRISAETRRNGGARFRVRLPSAPTPEGPKELPAATEGAA